MDARWIEGESGKYLTGGTLASPEADRWLYSISYGRETYPWSWISTRLGFEGVATSEADGYTVASTQAFDFSHHRVLLHSLALAET